MPNSVSIDTNLLIDDDKIIFKLAKEYDQIVITVTVLKELDKHKYDPNLSYSARRAIQSIREFKNQYPDKLKFVVSDKELTTNDLLIIEAALQTESVIATKDISMSIIAEAKGLETKIYDVVLNNIFNPYVHLRVETIYEHEEAFSWQQCYKKEDYMFAFDLFEECAKRHLELDAWFFVLIQAEKIKPYVYAHDPIKKQFIRIDNVTKYLEINLNGAKVKTLDVYQNCALFAINEAPHCLITGKWGSGKTLLVTAASLERTRKKIFITRPPIGINNKYDIGLLPGTKEDKMKDWLSGFSSALYHIYGNTNGQSDGKGGFNYVNDVLFPKYFEILPLNSIQGLSLLDEDILLVDEAQLINVDYMSMLLSRPSETGKLILMGDLKQSYSVVKPSESGLLKLLRILPHHAMAYVELKNSYRSDLLELADKLQDKSF